MAKNSFNLLIPLSDLHYQSSVLPTFLKLTPKAFENLLARFTAYDSSQVVFGLEDAYYSLNHEGI